MKFLPLIEAKRDGQSLSGAQLQEVVRAYTQGEIPDYQMAAFLMAVYFRGLSTRETTALTLAMRDSGVVLKFPRGMRPLVDKHSTGGVGDKVSLPLAPLLACLGFRVPMISGRGLGITGGTLDKLDSIPGFQTLLPDRRIMEIVQRVGCVICGQTAQMVPADRKLYALRDISGTVPSIPLITASILSKKLAENLDALVLDVKFGRAAFMQTKAEARKLARAMVELGRQCGVNTRAMLTDMNTPLGCAAGNWLEVKEAVACLEPRREELLPKGLADLRKVVLTSAAHLLVQTGKCRSLGAARKAAEGCLESGAPRAKWNEMLKAQGADLGAFKRKLQQDHTAAVTQEVKAWRSGYVLKCDARLLGEVIRDLGGGRLTKDSVIDHSVGVDRIAKPGDRRARGDTLARIHAASRQAAQWAATRLKASFKLSTSPPRRGRLIHETIE